MVPSEKILHWANVCFSAHATSEASQGLYDIKSGMLQVYQNEISQANSLVLLRTLGRTLCHLLY